MPPSKAADMLEEFEIQDLGLEVFETVIFDCKVFGAGANVGEEVPVWLWPVAAEVLQDICKRVLRHGDLE